MAEKTIIRNTDVPITETNVIDTNGDTVEWANVDDFKILLKGNFSNTYVNVDTDIDGQFTYYVESSFTQVNSYFTVIAEVKIINPKFSDGVQNLIQKLYDYTVIG